MPARITQEEFIRRSRNIHGDKYDYSKVKYVNKTTKVTIICPIHGKFEQKAEDHYRGRGCGQCGFNKHTELQTYTGEDFLLKARIKYGGKFEYDRNTGTGYNKPLRIICPKHGEFGQTPHNHLGCGTGCAKCGREKANNSASYSKQDFIDKAVLTHNNFYDYSKVCYVDYHTPVTIICPKHGEFKQAPVNHANGQGCPKCILKTQAKLGDKIRKRFPSYFNEGEYSPEGLPKQRIDIADITLKVGIEFDGQQHYEPIKCFGGEERFKWQIEQDRKKEKCCEENNFILFRLKYNYKKQDFEELCLKIQEIIDNTGQITEENGKE